MKTIYSLFMTALLVAGTFNLLSEAQEPSIDGTYVLESREFPDGSLVTPPVIVGLYNLDAGHVNFNLLQRGNGGKALSMSFIGTYTFTPAEFTQEILYFSVNDQISGAGVEYDFEKKSGSSPVTVKDGVIEFVFPPHMTIRGRFDGNSFKAERVDGSYVDNWKRVE